MEQLALDGFITCDQCRHGRPLGANDYGCRSKKRRASGEKLVNKAGYTCEYAEGKDDL